MMKPKKMRRRKSTSKSHTELREVCAQAFGMRQCVMTRPFLEELPNKMGSTMARKKILERGKGSLRELGDIASEAEYLAVAEKFDGTTRETAMSSGGQCSHPECDLK